MSEVQYKYDAFISYSHQRDVPLATALQDGLHGLARNPYTRRPKVRIFRDTTSLAASTDLSGAIKAALATSRYFIYLASPEAAESRWVQEEISYWRGNHSMDHFLIALSDGEIAWDGSARDFDWTRSSALPEGLRGAFASEPLWVGLRTFRDIELYSMTPGSPFRDKVVTIAAPLHGCSKDELDSNDLRLERKATRFKRAMTAGMAVTTAIALIAAAVAFQQRNQANARARASASQALAARSIEEAQSDPRKASQFALYADAVDATGEAAEALGQAVLADDSTVVNLQTGAGGFYPYAGAGHVSVTNVAVSWDGKLLAYYSTLDPELRDRGHSVVHLYDIQKHKELPGLHAQWPQNSGGLAFSWDSQLLAMEAPSNQIEVWNVAQHRLIRTITASNTDQLSEAAAGLWQFAFSGDGKRLAAAFYAPSPGGDKEIFHLAVWDVPTGRQLTNETIERESTSLAFDDKNQLLALDSEAGTIRTMPSRAASWTAPRKIPGFPRTDSRHVSLSVDATRAYIDGDASKKDELWDLVKDRRLAVFDNSLLNDPFMLGAGRPVLSGPEVTIYDATLNNQRNLGSFSFGTFALSMSGDGRWVAAGSSDGAVSLFSTTTHLTKTVLQNAPSIRSSELTPDGRLALRANKGNVDLWSVTNQGFHHFGRIPLGHFDEMNQPAFIANDKGTRVLVEQDTAVTLWDARTGTNLAFPWKLDPTFSPVSFLPDGHHFLAVESGKIKVMDSDSAKIPQVIPLRSLSPDNTEVSSDDIGVSMDRKTVAVWVDGELSVWRWVDDGYLEREQQAAISLQQTFIKSVAIDAHGKKVAAVNEDGRIAIMDVTTGEVVQSTTPFASGSTDIAFSPDSALVVQASANELQFWDSATGESRGIWPAGSQNSDASFPEVLSEPSGAILTLEADGALARQTINLKAWRDALCNLVPDPLPQDEYDRYLKGLDVAAPCS